MGFADGRGGGRVVRLPAALSWHDVLVDVALSEESLGASGAAGLLDAFAAEIEELYPGWNPGVGPAAAPKDFAAPGGVFLLAHAGQHRVGCGGLKRLDERRAEIKRLYVVPEARGEGVARRILEGLELAALARGYDTVRLDTGARQPAALALFRSAGYIGIGDYNGNPVACHWLEKRLTRGGR
jgi:GNAT superfamily N-acetyltransferase